MKKQIAAFLCLLFGPIAHSSLNAQGYLYQTGVPTFSTQIPVENGFINVNNGDIHIEIPLATHSQRGSLQLTERLVYDSRIWKIVQNGGYSWQPTNVPNSMGGWLFYSGAETGSGLSYATTSGTQSSGGNQCAQTYTAYSAFNWTDPQGTSHVFLAPQTISYGTPSVQCNTSLTNSPTTSGYAADGSGYFVSVTNYNQATIYDKSGNVYYPGTSAGTAIQDRNGNYWARDSDGNLIDTIGRTPVKVSTNGNLIYYDVLGEGGVNERYTVTTQTVYYNTDFLQSGVTEASGSFTAIESVLLPDGSSYSFTYDSGTLLGHYGDLASVTLPAGGVIQYGYTKFFDSFGNANHWINTRVKDGGTTTFTPATISNCSSTNGCQEQVTVTSPPDSVSSSGNATVYTFNLDSGAYKNAASWNAGIDVYQGLASNGAHLQSSATTYTYQTAYIGTGSFLLPTGSTTTTSLPAIGLSAQTSTVMDLVGNPTSIEQWDYYSGSAPSNPTIETNYVYGYSVNNAEFPTQITVTDGTGNQVSQIAYAYDETTGYGHAALSSVSGLPQNPVAVTGNRGNLTTTSQWLNTGVAISRMATYDSAGTLLSNTDPNGNTSYGYDSTDTFPTNANPPTPSSGVTLSTSTGFDASTGLVTSSTDPNGTQTMPSSYDAFGRPGEVDVLNGKETYAKTTYGYSSTQLSVHSYQNASVYGDTETLYDGYGRKSRVAVYNGQGSNGWYQVDYCYDTTGRLQFQSMIYQSTGFTAAKQCSGTGITYTYDALGRPLTATNPDGTTTYTYTGRAVKTTDVNGVQTIQQTDGLGRTSAICEISSNFSMPGSGSPGPCGMDISGTGFLTSYSYNLASHTTTVTQGVQQRVFQTDSAGRTIYTSEPERGVTTYGYAYNSTGLVVTRQRPAANQTNPAVLTTTTTQYDSLGRPVSISYNDGVTPNKNFFYDMATGWNGLNLGASKGRLTYAWTNQPWTGTQFVYDPMGQVVQSVQCLPNRCGNSIFDVNLLYSHDWVGNLTKDTYFLGANSGTEVDTNYSPSPAGELTSISNTLTGTTNYSGAILSNVQNGPNGPISYQFGNGYLGTSTYDTLGRLTGKVITTPPPNCQFGCPVYGVTSTIHGSQVTSLADSSLGRNLIISYDEFGRLVSAAQNTAYSYAWTYDRWGNRWSQNVTEFEGNSPQLSINTANNQVIGATYDAAGNMTSDDGFYNYNYDAEGNFIALGSGASSAAIYDAFNHRVQSVDSGATTQFAFNLDGRRVLAWQGTSSTPTLVEAVTYWNGLPVSYFDGTGTSFTHYDPFGTKRAESNYYQVGGWFDGMTSTYTSLPFGDGYGEGYGNSGVNGDANHFALLDQDLTSGTEHAQFRQYSAGWGRWMSPDPYDGSYDAGNPQSFNRYSYVGNMPLSFTDPTGLDGTSCTICSIGIAAGVTALVDELEALLRRPQFRGTTTPRPNAQPWDEYHIHYGANIAGAFGLPGGAGCEFGACGFQQGSTPQTTSTVLSYAYDFSEALLFAPSNRGTPLRLFGSHWCGPGGAGSPNSDVDRACQMHDTCLGDHGINFWGNIAVAPVFWTSEQKRAAQVCNQALYNTVKQYPNEPGSKPIQNWLKYGNWLGILSWGTNVH